MEPSSAPWRVLESAEPSPTESRAEPPGRPWLAIGAAVLAVVVAGVGVLFATRSEPVIGVEGEGVSVPGSLVRGSPPPSDPVAAAAPLVVEVGGAVARPGVYRLTAGSRVGDAISAAGGFGSRVDVEAADRALNLAALVHDGDEIHVPVRGEAGSSAPVETGGAKGSGTLGGGASAAGPIDVNRAGAEELDTLPGIGPATAAKIIAAREERPFASLEDFASRKVVGAATLAKIRALVTVGP